MPARQIVAKKIADLLGVLAHPYRIRLIEELASGAMDVSTLEQILELPQSTVSQHLSQLKKVNLVKGEREGKRVVYSLTKGWIARWLIEALKLIEEESEDRKSLKVAVGKARKLWGGTITHGR